MKSHGYSKLLRVNARLLKAALPKCSPTITPETVLAVQLLKLVNWCITSWCYPVFSSLIIASCSSHPHTHTGTQETRRRTGNSAPKSARADQPIKTITLETSPAMKSAILYPYGPLRANGCCRMLHAKHLALTSAIYTLVSTTHSWARGGILYWEALELQSACYHTPRALVAIFASTNPF